MKTDIRKYSIVAVLLTALFVISYNSSANLHMHRDGLGRILAHSHPVAPASGTTDPIQQHSHSNVEFFIYHILHVITFLLVAVFLGFIFDIPCIGGMHSSLRCLTSAFSQGPESIRAPPHSLSLPV